MNRGVDHGSVFFDDADRVEFGQRLEVIHDELGIETHAYCLLDNHYHLLVHCPDAGLSDAMQGLGSVFTRHVNDRIGRDGPLFRGRFHSRHIDTDAYLINVVRYIHRNALDISGITAVDQYRWSSHRTYLGHRATPSWMRTDFILSQFNGSQGAFHDFVSNESDARPIPVGTDPAVVLAAVRLIVAQFEPRLLGSKRPYERVLTTLIATQLAATDRDALYAELGLRSQGAVRTAIYRARQRLVDSPMVEPMLTATQDLLAASHLGSDPKCDAA